MNTSIDGSRYLDSEVSARRKTASIRRFRLIGWETDILGGSHGLQLAQYNHLVLGTGQLGGVAKQGTRLLECMCVCLS